MAITIETDFEDYSPVYNTLQVAISSDNVANPGFQYIFEVTVEGETAKEFKMLPEPSNDFGVKDFHHFLETFVKPEFGQFDTVNGFEYSDDTIRKFDILYKEEWLSGGLPVLGDTLQGADKYIWEGSFPHHKWVDQMNETDPFNTWLCNATNGGKEFLTNQKTKTVQIGDLGWTWFMTDTPNDCKILRVETYDSAGASIASFEISNILATTGTLPRLQRVATAPQSLNNVDGAQVTLGVQPIITSSVASYTVEMRDAVGTPSSEILTFNIDTDCRYPSARIHFENELGGYDAFNFSFRNQLSEDYERKTYMQNPYNVTASGLEFKHENASQVAHYLKSTNKIKLRSDYLTFEENEWLKELRKSTSVYLEFTDLQGNKNFKPIKGGAGNWVERDPNFDKLFNVEFDLEFSWNDYSQRK